MGFTKGTVSFQRFAAQKVASFELEHLDRLVGRVAGHQTVAAADGVETGWTAGAHVLDKTFSFEKNICPEHLLFDFWVQKDRLPSDKLKAYYQIEVAALAKANPSGFPSAKNKRDAKEAARERLEEEAKDGRYRKAQVIPVCWDGRTGTVYFGSPSRSNIDRFCLLFEKTFDIGLEYQSAGKLADAGEVEPKPYCSWIADASTNDWLGNAFLVWLWHYLDHESDTVTLEDFSEATAMFARSLTLDCPRGIAGKDVFTADGPARLPEARRALQAGKMPRSAGLTLVRHGKQFEFKLNAETFAVSSCKLPPPDDDVVEARAKVEDRLGSLRDLTQAIDMLYAVFVRRRTSAEWPQESESIKNWLNPGGKS